MGNFTLGRYLPLDSPVHKMDPRAKIIAMLVMLIAVFITSAKFGMLKHAHVIADALFMALGSVLHFPN